MSRWEYHEEHLDFSKVTIPKSHLQGTISIMGNMGIRVFPNDVPIRKIKFYYRNFTSFNTQDEMRYQAWQLISPIIQQRVNDLGAQGWELTTSLSPSLVHTNQAGIISDGLSILICIVFFPLAFVLLIYMYLVGSDYFVYVSADLPFRRSIP